MADVSNPGRLHQQILSTGSTGSTGGTLEDEDEEERAFPNLYSFDFGFVSSPNAYFNFTTISEPDSVTQESESVHSGQNFFFHGSEYEDVDDEEQMNFVTDLFATRQGPPDEPDNFEFECAYIDEEPELLGSENRVSISSPSGLRVVDMESESDSETVEVNSGVDIVDNRDGLLLDSNDDLGLPGFWDCLRLDRARVRASLNEEFEWEGVNIRENLSSLIDRIEEISVSSDGESSPFDNDGEGEEDDDEENAGNAEWEFLLAINNLERVISFDEYNVLFGELVEGESTLRGSPPAAKSVVENLPLVVLTFDDLTMNNVVCAVCKDEVCVGVKVTRLPCCHHYHHDCILPWLSIRNTCPLCRYELPTDDLDYERRKNSLVDDLQVRYNYQLLP